MNHLPWLDISIILIYLIAMLAIGFYFSRKNKTTEQFTKASGKIPSWAIGLSLGGTTGYAINPARDLGPRIVHSILPIKDKNKDDWKYAWIPVISPIVGALLAAMVFKYFLS